MSLLQGGTLEGSTPNNFIDQFKELKEGFIYTFEQFIMMDTFKAFELNEGFYSPS
jgi:hypothetical protein